MVSRQPPRDSKLSIMASQQLHRGSKTIDIQLVKRVNCFTKVSCRSQTINNPFTAASWRCQAIDILREKCASGFTAASWRFQTYDEGCTAASCRFQTMNISLEVFSIGFIAASWRFRTKCRCRGSSGSVSVQASVRDCKCTCDDLVWWNCEVNKAPTNSPPASTRRTSWFWI